MTLRGEQLCCLIVDDNPAFLKTAARMLKYDGFSEIRTASTIAEALQSMDEYRPDVTLVDVYLGDESGFDLVEQLDRRGWCSRSAVILISTHDAQEFADVVAAGPAVGFLPKLQLSPSAIHGLLAARDRDSAD
jgi:response regulator of citrate/malate metabolism